MKKLSFSMVTILLAVMLCFTGVLPMNSAKAEGKTILDQLTVEYLFNGLGDALSYGVVAREWTQGAHAETSVCVDRLNKNHPDPLLNTDTTFLYSKPYALMANVSAPSGESLEGMKFALFIKNSDGSLVMQEETVVEVSQDSNVSVVGWNIELGSDLISEKLYVRQVELDGSGYEVVNEGDTNAASLEVYYGPSITSAAPNDSYIGRMYSNMTAYNGWNEEWSSPDIINIFNSLKHNPRVELGPTIGVGFDRNGAWQDLLSLDYVTDEPIQVYVSYYNQYLAMRFPDEIVDQRRLVSKFNNIYYDYDRATGKGYFYLVKDGVTYPVELVRSSSENYASTLLEKAKTFSEKLAKMPGGTVDSSLTGDQYRQNAEPSMLGNSTVTGPEDSNGNIVSIYNVEVGNDWRFTSEDFGWIGNDRKYDGILIAPNEYVVFNVICPTPQKDGWGNVTSKLTMPQSGDMWMRTGANQREEAGWDGTGTGANDRVLYNIVYKNETTGEYVPFNGTIVPSSQHGGTVLAPLAHMEVTDSPPNGAMIVNSVYNDKEIHQRTMTNSDQTTWVRMQGDEVEAVGHVKLTKVDAADGSLLANAVFGIYSDSECETKLEDETTDVNGEIVFSNLTPGNYYVREISPPSDDYILDKSIYKVEVRAGETTIVNSAPLTNSTGRGTLKLLKRDADTNEAIVGAVFGLYAKDDSTKLLRTLTTDVNGNITVRLAVGEYVLREISAPYGYKLLTETLDVTITDGEITVVSSEGQNGVVVNEKLPIGTLKIQKVDEVDTNKKLADVEFNIYRDYACKNLVGTIKTNPEGLGTIELPIGTYYLKETKVPKNYVLDTEIYMVEVREGAAAEVTAVTITNEPYGELKLIKVDENNKKLEHVEFTVYSDDAGTQEVAKFTTKKEGDGSVKLPAGTYYVKETWSSNESNIYDINRSLVEVTIEPGVTTWMGENGTVTNEFKKGSFYIQKITADNGVWNSYINMQPLANAKFGIYSDRNCRNEVATGWTGADGKVSFTLPLGQYWIKEIQAPPGYNTNTTVVEFWLNEGDNNKQIKSDFGNWADRSYDGAFLNTKKNGLGRLIMYKEDENGQGLNGVGFKLYLDPECTRPYDDVVYRTTTIGTGKPEDGKLQITGLPLGTYYVKEVEPLDGYELNETVFTANVNQAAVGDDVAPPSQAVGPKGETALVNYKAESKLQLEIPVEKVLEDGDTDETFTFKLEPAPSSPPTAPGPADGDQQAAVTGDGTPTDDKFGVIEVKYEKFVSDDVYNTKYVEYGWLVYEEPGEDPNIVYDDTVYWLVASVVENENSELALNGGLIYKCEPVSDGEFIGNLEKTTDGYTNIKKFFSNYVKLENPTVLQGAFTTADLANHIIFTNKVLSTSISVTKEWPTGDNGIDLRDKLTLHKLAADGTISDALDGYTPTRGSDGNTYTWEGLPKYEMVNGQKTEITYVVKETAQEAYNTVYPNNQGYASHTETIENQLKTTDISVKKVWDDDDTDHSNDRIQVQLYNGTTAVGAPVVLNKDNNWEYTWPNLPMYAVDADGNATLIDYNVDELSVPNGYVKNVSEEGAKTTITNTLIKGATGKLTVNKTVQNIGTGTANSTDQFSFKVERTSAPEGAGTFEAATVSLSDKGSQEVNLSFPVAGTYVYKVHEIIPADDEKLPGYTYDDAVYTVTFVVTPDNAQLKAGTPTWTKTKAGQTTTSVTSADFVNKYGAVSAQLTATKVLQGEGIQLAAEQFSFELKGPNAYGEVEVLQTKSNAADGTVTFDAIEYKADGEYKYTISEKDETVPEGYVYDKTVHHVTVNVATVNGKMEATVDYAPTDDDTLGSAPVFTNKYGMTQIEVTKIWDDANNQDGKRPDSITIRLWNGTEEVRSATLSATGEGDAKTWPTEVTFDKLPMYDSDGQVITYTVTEDKVTDYSTQVNNATYTITNTYAPGMTSVSVEKVWSDSDNVDGLRPGEITVNLLAGGVVKDSIVLDDTNSWKHTFANLAAKNAGQEIVYTVEEVTKDGEGNDLPWVKEYSGKIEENAAKTGYIITNTREATKISIKVTKTWVDDDNKLNKRPDSIAITLLADGNPVGDSVTLTKANADANDANTWTYEFTGLPMNKTGSVASPITYTITEAAVEHYDTDITGDAAMGFTVTNTCTYAADGKLHLEGVKKLTGDVQAVPEKTFAFGIYKGDVKVADGYNTADGKIVFDTVQYTQNDIGATYLYTVKEIPGPASDATYNYTYDETVYSVSVNVTDDGEGGLVVNKSITKNSQPASIEFTNAIVNKVGHIGVLKVDKKDTAKGLPDAVFGVYSEADCNKESWKGDIRTGETGAGSLMNLPIGTYYVQESVAPKGYLLDNTIYTVVVVEGETAMVNGVHVTNTKLGRLMLEKSDRLNPDKKLPGAVYTLYNDEACLPEDKVADITTGDNGIGSLEGVPAGTYWVKETKAPEGYEVDPLPYKVVVAEDADPDQPVFVQVSDFPLRGALTISKTVVGVDETTESFLFDIELSITTADPIVGSYEATLNGLETAKVTFAATEKGAKATVSLKSGETLVIRGLRDGVTYTVTEQPNSRYDVQVNGAKAAMATGTIKENAVSTAAFQNTLKQTGFTVEKVWQGAEGGEIQLTLFANGVQVDPQPEYTKEGSKYSYADLTMVDEKGQEIVYTVKETAMAGYTTSYKNIAPYADKTDCAYNGGQIINQALTSFSVKKEWAGLAEGEKAPAIQLTLYCNGTIVTKETPKPDAKGWYVYNDLPATVEGKAAVYTVKEEPLSGYTTTYLNKGEHAAVTDCAHNGSTIVNSKIPQTGDGTPLALWMTTMLLAALGLVGLKAYSRKREN